MGILARMALLSAVASLALESAAACSRVPTRIVDGTFASVESAVRAHAGSRLDDSVRNDREWVGGVLRVGDGRYRITEGVGCRGRDTVTFSVAVTAGSELVAFWHTHGGRGPARHYFSPDDARVVATTGRDFYLLTPTGELKVLEPAHARLRATHYAGATVAVAGFEA